MAEGRKPVDTPARTAAVGRAGCVVTALLLLALPPAGGAQVEAAANDAWTSRSAKYRVSYTSELEPIVINRIHNWVLHVENTEGDVVANARISIDGGMPQHDHGLPTEPVMTRYLGDGDYLVEGLRFHMNGYWEVSCTIASGDTQDTVVIPLEL